MPEIDENPVQENAAAPEGAHEKRVCPTLLIGLGGTGKQTLLQLRRMMLDSNHGGTRFPPFVKFLMIDSDTRAVNIDGKQMDEFLLACQFVENEKIDTPLKPADLDNLQSNQNAYPHVFSWFDPALLSLPRPANGNSQIRSFGRLAFTLYYTKIRKRLEDLRDQLINANLEQTVHDKYNIQLDMANIDCFVVFSLAGGTGAGMFIDIAYLLKDVFPGIKLHGIAVTPDVFVSVNNQTDDEARKAFGNGYASLLELEHYNYQRDTNPKALDARYRVCWTKAAFEARDMRNPGVYEITWLVGGAPRSGAGVIMPDDKEQLTGMIAEWLFLQFGTHDGTLVNSMNSRASNWVPRANLPGALSFTINGENHQIGASKAYCSLGLAKIHIPSNAIARRNAHRLVSDISTVWLEEAKLGDIQQVVEDRYSDVLMLKPGEDGEVGRTLRMSLCMSGGIDLFQQIDNKFAEKAADLRHPEPGARKTVKEWFKRDIEQALVNEGEPNPELRGAFYKTIAVTRPAEVEKALRVAIDAIISACSAAPGGRLGLATAILNELKRRYADIAKIQRELAGQRDDAIKMRRACADKVLNWSDDHGKTERVACLRAALDQYAWSIKERLAKISHEATADLANRIVVLIGQGTEVEEADKSKRIEGQGLLKEVEDLRANIALLKKRVDDRLAALNNVAPSQLHQELRPSDDAIGSSYCLADGTKISIKEVYGVEARMLTGADLGGITPWQLRRKLAGGGGTNLLVKMLDFAGTVLQPISFDRFDVLDAFDLAYGQNDNVCKSKIQTLYNKAAPRWTQTTAIIARVDGERRPPDDYLVMEPGHSQAKMNFLKHFEGLAGERYNSVEGPKDSIHLIRHILDLTLSEWPNLKRWRDDYETITDSRIENRAGSILNTMLAVDILPELLPPNDNEAEKLMASLTTCAEALSLGILEGAWETPKGAVIIWSMKETTIFGEKAKVLGRLPTVIRAIRRNNPIGQALTAKVEGTLPALTDEQRIRAVLILNRMLADLDDEHIVVNAATSMGRSQPGWKGALKTAIERIGGGRFSEASLTEAWNRDHSWFEEVPEGSGFYRVCTPTT